MSNKDPKVGVGVFCFKPDGTFIIGKRKGALGSGSYGLPGGHLEFGESFAYCAAREVLEETGLTIPEKDIVFLTAGNNVFEKAGKHYITIAMGCFIDEGAVPAVLEPEKCEGWIWISWERLCQWADDDLKSDGGKKLFQPMVEFVTQNEKGFDPFIALKQKRGKKV